MPSNPEMDLTRASGNELDRWAALHEAREYVVSLAAMRDEILRQARAQWEQERGTPLSDSEVAGMIRDLNAGAPSAEGSDASDAEVLRDWAYSARVIRAAYARGMTAADGGAYEDLEKEFLAAERRIRELTADAEAWKEKWREAARLAIVVDAASPAPDVRALQREAANRALAYVYDQINARPAVDKDVALAVLINARHSQQGYLAREYPDPAPPSVTQRIDEYLTRGGLFNPEMANHDAVRELLIDCRAALAASHGGGK